MIHFVYLNYGPSEAFRWELKYSFLTLRQFIDPDRHRVAIYTDAPEIFAGWPATVISIAGKTDEYSRGGRLNHRIKPNIVLDALRRFDEPVVYLDSDSVVLDGFAAQIAEKIRHGAIMSAFEALDPLPQLAGFAAVLPNAGRYRYDPEQARMFNAGLIGARPDHVPVIEDAIALTDAYLDHPPALNRREHLEQLAFAEAFRTHGVAIAAIDDVFLHYWKRSWKRYADWRLPRILPADWNDLGAPRAALRFKPATIRLFAAWHSVKKRMPG